MNGLYKKYPPNSKCLPLFLPKMFQWVETTGIISLSLISAEKRNSSEHWKLKYCMQSFHKNAYAWLIYSLKQMDSSRRCNSFSIKNIIPCYCMCGWCESLYRHTSVVCLFLSKAFPLHFKSKAQKSSAFT